MDYRTIYSWDSELSADSVEFCPIEGHRDILVVGTYFVSASDADTFSPSQRRGRIYLMELKHQGESESGRILQVLQTLEVDAVLDMKWSTSQPLLAVGDAKGTISVYSLSQENQLVIRDKTSIKVENSTEEDLALSLDWNDRKAKGFCGDLQIVVSGSQGNVSIFKVNGCGDQVKLSRSSLLAKCHDFEAWIATFDVHSGGDRQLVYSGGDDAALKAFDTRLCDDSGGSGDVATPVLVNRKQHTAGVTSLLSDIHHPFRLYSGSYDDTLAVWDTRMFRGPSDQLNLGGGVWRIRQHLTDPNTLALAAMYNGFHIYDASLNSSVVHFKEHESLAYGIDFRHGESETGLSKTLVSCSFYDHLVKVWEVTPTSPA